MRVRFEGRATRGVRRQVDGEAEAKLRAHGRSIWQRLLYTSHYFGGINPQRVGRRCTYQSCCLGCSPASRSCAAEAAAASAQQASAVARGEKARERARFHTAYGAELHDMRLSLPNGSALPHDLQARCFLASAPRHSSTHACARAPSSCTRSFPPHRH